MEANSLRETSSPFGRLFSVGLPFVLLNLLWAGWLFQNVSPLEIAAVWLTAASHFWNSARYELFWGLAAPALVVLTLLTVAGIFFVLKNRKPLAVKPAPLASGRRVTRLIVGLLLLSLVFFFLRSTNVPHGLLGLFLSLTACGVGLRLLAICRGFSDDEAADAKAAADRLGFIEKTPPSSLILAAALGFGFLIFFILGVGSLGLPSPWAWRALLTALFIWSWPPLRRLSARGFACLRRNPWSENDPRQRVAWFLAAAAALWLLLHVPLWYAPPLEYDVLEYHLGAPAEHLRAGRIEFLPHNIYAAMPAAGEMLFLWGLLIGGGRLEGLPTAHAVLWSFWALSALATYCLADGAFSQGEKREPRKSLNGEPLSLAGAAAAFLFVFVPMGVELATDFYVEHVQAFFHLAALCAVTAFFKANGSAAAPLRLAALAGICCGLAAGAKFTGLLLTALPLGAFLLFGAWQRHSRQIASLCMLAFGGALTLTFLPWPLRNGVQAGDPLYPFGRLLARRAWGENPIRPDALAYFDAAHQSGPWSVGALWKSLRELFPPLSPPRAARQWADDTASGPQLVCFPWLIFAVRGLVARPETLLLIFIFVADVLLWFLFTHRLPRFLFPCLGPAAALGGIGIACVFAMSFRAGSRWPRRLARVWVAGIVCLTVFCVLPSAPWSAARAAGAVSTAWLFGRQNAFDAAVDRLADSGKPATAAAWKFLAQLPPSAKPLFLGEAQTFYFPQTPLYAVVFDRQPFAELFNAEEATPELWKQRLRHRGVTHVFLNYPELSRLMRSYALRPDSTGAWRQSLLPEIAPPPASPPGLAAFFSEILRIADEQRSAPAMPELANVPIGDVETWLPQNARLVFAAGTGRPAAFQIWALTEDDETANAELVPE
jgi:hypothetical protein